MKAYVNRGVVSLMTALVVLPQLSSASSSDGGTLTAGQSASSACPPPFHGGAIYFVGYDNYTSEGAYTPTKLTGGDTVTAVFDTHSTCSGSHVSSSLIVTGFTSDPGAGWLVSITCNGVGLGAGASYFWEGGVPEAIWEWTTGFGFANGTQYSCTIVHN